MNNKSLKILHIANFKTEKDGLMFYNTDNKIQHGLIELGHYVHGFDYKFMVRKSNIFNTTSLSHKKVHEQLIQLCENIKFDVILIGHIDLPTNLLQRFRQVLPNAKLVMWFVDTINEPQRLTHLHQMHSQIDNVFVTTGGQYLQQLSANASNPVFSFTPNLTLHSIEYARPNWNDYKYDLIFCGSNAKSVEREEFLNTMVNRLPNFNFKFGNCLGHPALFGHEYQVHVRDSLMGLSYSRYTDIYMYSSDRIAQLTGMGNLVFSAHNEGLELLYPSDTMVHFRDTNELIERLDFYQKHPEKAIEMAQRSYQLAHTIYEAKNVLRQWLNLVFDQPLHSPWQQEVYQNNKRC